MGSSQTFLIECLLHAAILSFASFLQKDWLHTRIQSRYIFSQMTFSVFHKSTGTVGGESVFLCSLSKLSEIINFLGCKEYQSFGQLIVVGSPLVVTGHSDEDIKNTRCFSIDVNRSAPVS